MVSIEEALSIIGQQKISLTTITVALSEANGSFLGKSILSPFDLPSFDNSAMDGYAICGECETYEIIGEIAAGNTAHHSLEDGQAMRIFTGGKVPDKTLAVIMQEKTEVEGKVLRIQDKAIPGKNIRRQGDELARGQEVFSPGHLITPASIGLIGSLGLSQVEVFQKPTIRMISTGNELIQPGERKNEGQIYESNSHALSAALSRHGFESVEKQHIRDDFQAIKEGIGMYLEDSDVLLLSGGISVGDYDYVKQALAENGVEELFYKVFQKPGKPLFFGRKGSKFVFALPGNPASSLTCLYIYVLLLLQKLSGAGETGLPNIKVPMAHDYEMKSDRPSFLKAKIGNETVSILDGQSSSMIHSMAMGNALALVTEPGKYAAGDMVKCILI